jgi:hypothetical protein
MTTCASPSLSWWRFAAPELPGWQFCQPRFSRNITEATSIIAMVKNDDEIISVSTNM